MKNKQPQQVSKELRAFVLKALDKYCAILHVEHYEGTVEYMTEDDLNTNNAGMTMTVRRRYLDFTLKVYPPAIRMWLRGEKEDVEHMVGHEASHILTEHMKDLAIACYKDEGETLDAFESLTESISRLAIRIGKLEKK